MTWGLSPDHIDVVLPDCRIGGKYRDALELWLRNQEAIPRIAMDQRQRSSVREALGVVHIRYRVGGH